jgi:hypothetical protein
MGQATTTVEIRKRVTLDEVKAELERIKAGAIDAEVTDVTETTNGEGQGA